jgi:uncharacterized iron-regulated membrane protein
MTSDLLHTLFILRILGGLALFMILLTVAGFIVSRNEKRKSVGTAAVNSRPTTNHLKEIK